MTRREEIVAYIARHWERGYGPSYREIAEAVGYTTTSMVEYHLRILRDEGKVTFEDGLARTVRVVA